MPKANQASRIGTAPLEPIPEQREGLPNQSGSVAGVDASAQDKVKNNEPNTEKKQDTCVDTLSATEEPPAPMKLGAAAFAEEHGPGLADTTGGE